MLTVIVSFQNNTVGDDMNLYRLSYILNLLACVLSGCAAFEEVDPYANTNQKNFEEYSGQRRFGQNSNPLWALCKEFVSHHGLLAKFLLLRKGHVVLSGRWGTNTEDATPENSNNISGLSVVEKVEIYLNLMMVTLLPQRHHPKVIPIIDQK